MRFSPLLISNLIIQPLRYFFSYYSNPEITNLKYDNDEKISTMEISVLNDFNKVALQLKPRILVSRGTFIIDKTGISNNLAMGKTMTETKGLQDDINMVLFRGQATILIEARNEGVVELMTDMVSHFLTWSVPYICNTQGFKDFGLPMTISEPTPAKEDKDIFQVHVNLPYSYEEQWHVNNDALKLREFYMNLIKAD